MAARDADALANRAVDRSVQFSSPPGPIPAPPDEATVSDSEDVPEDAPFVDHLNTRDSNGYMNCTPRIWNVS